MNSPQPAGRLDERPSARHPDTLDTPPQSTRRRRWLQGTAAALAGVALGRSPARPRTSGRHALRIGFQKYGNFVVLKARGTLEKRLASQGVTVEWLEFPAGPQLLEGLNAGAIDVGTVGETPPIFAQAAGVDFVYIGNEPPAPRGEAIVVLPDSPIRRSRSCAARRSRSTRVRTSTTCS
jgi:sulfonate transport system substrate-binding protein